MRFSALAVVGVLVAAALPVVAARVRGPGPARCSRDGTVLAGTLRIRAEHPDRETARFCSVRCASDWIARSGAGWEAIVADETNGSDVPASRAWFARSRVAASPASGENIHAFANRADADAHVALYGGRVLEGGDRPFGSEPEGAPQR